MSVHAIIFIDKYPIKTKPYDYEQWMNSNEIICNTLFWLHYLTNKTACLLGRRWTRNGHYWKDRYGLVWFCIELINVLTYYTNTLQTAYFKDYIQSNKVPEMCSSTFFFKSSIKTFYREHCSVNKRISSVFTLETCYISLIVHQFYNVNLFFIRNTMFIYAYTILGFLFAHCIRMWSVNVAKEKWCGTSQGMRLT